MAAERGQNIDFTNGRGQIEPGGQAELAGAPSRLCRALTEAELAQVAGGTEGPPTGAGNDNGVTNKATPILF
jgi:hypothetical protein